MTQNQFFSKNKTDKSVQRVTKKKTKNTNKKDERKDISTDFINIKITKKECQKKYIICNIV